MVLLIVLIWLRIGPLPCWPVRNISIVLRLFPRIFVIVFSEYWSQFFFTNSTFADWAEQGLTRLLQPLINTLPTIEMPTRGHNRLLDRVKTNIAFKDAANILLFSLLFGFFLLGLLFSLLLRYLRLLLGFTSWRRWRWWSCCCRCRVYLCSVPSRPQL